ncbi:MAG: hypothetical protein PHP98_07080 [Kiritimatiellae bacterium]|nr:hypothetical protein [Kiritimatiellia bacterium]
MKKQDHTALSVFCRLLVPAVSIALVTGCVPQKDAPAPAAPAAAERISSGQIELAVLAEPAQVHLDRDILLTLRVCAPSNMEVHPPALSDRLKGFALSGSFIRSGPPAAGKFVREYCFRLTPTLADEYRIAPLAVAWTNHAVSPPAAGWFATRPLCFQAVQIAPGAPAASIQDIAGPVWIYPAFRTVAGWAAAILAAAGVIFLLWRMSRRIHRAVKLRRMSPRERALYELNELLEQDFIAKQQVKEFYLKITMIVRRYIERAHSIRAPEQTTEEFLAAAAGNGVFSREVVGKLRAFLQTADLVKFAAYRPGREIIGQTVSTARDYIETDAPVRDKTKNT